MKKHFINYFFVVITSSLFAQHDADNWNFGILARIDFSSGNAIVLSAGTLSTTEGCSSASDTAGNILFYTDGVSVWNKNNQIMPNGTGLMGTVSSTQSALVVPLPLSNTMFYIFTVDEIGGSNGFRYSIVDITLQSGMGDVTLKNVSVLANVTEKLTAVNQLSTNNYWVAVHEWASNAFYVYNLTIAGLQNIPVISNTGIVHTNAQIQNTYGQMKFNPCGNKLALAAGYLDTVEVFDFNTLTGMVSNPISLVMGAHVYGVEFSRNGQLLYVSTYDPLGTLLQFDLSAGTAAAILASKTVLSTTPDIYGLQMAPDGKIYVCKSFNQFLGVITLPSLAGTACNYIDNGLDLDPFFGGVTSGLGLPGFVQSAFRGEVVCNTTGFVENKFQFSENFVYPNPSSSDFAIINSDLNPFDKLEVIDISGRVIEYSVINQANRNFTFGKTLMPGNYFIRLSNKKENRIVKVIKLQLI